MIAEADTGISDLDAAYWVAETDSLALIIEALAASYAPETNPWAELEADLAAAELVRVAGDPAVQEDHGLSGAEATLRKETADADRKRGKRGTVTCFEKKK